MPLFLTLVAALPAQNYITFLNDWEQPNGGDSIPLGASYAPYDDYRTQQLIPAALMPQQPCVITALEVCAKRGGTVPYKSLRISVGHTSLTRLTTTFATNLPKPTSVVQLTDQSVSYARSPSWTSFKLVPPFAHDGKSGLVIEIQKLVDRTRSPQFVYHRLIDNSSGAPFTPAYDHTLQAPGRNSPTGRVINRNAITMRLRISGAPTFSVFAPGVGGSQGAFYLGSTFTLTTQAAPGEAFLDAFDFNASSAPFAIPGIAGGFWLTSAALVLGGGTIPAGGRGDLRVTVPTINALAGRDVHFQSVAISPVGAKLTNVVAGRISP